MTLATLLRRIIEAGLQAGQLERWPTEITLVGHFTLADLATLADFGKLKLRFDSIRGTYVSLSRRKAPKLTVHDSGGHSHCLTVILRDTLLLTPGGSHSLDALGELVGLPKVDLTEGQIEKMEELFQHDPELFQRYAQRDPAICVAHAVDLRELNEELTGKAEVPVTLSALAVGFLLKLWKDHGISADEVLGKEVLEDLVWSSTKGLALPQKRSVPIMHRRLHESLAVEAFHGGRNEQFIFGAGRSGDWTDWDLAGAYTTVMASQGLPLWEKARVANSLDDFQVGTLGLAWVKFQFPDGTRFPCLPVRTLHGLLFPLTGESFCGSDEIWHAGRMGSQITVLHGVVVPTDDRVRPFEVFVRECTRRRMEYPDGHVRNALFKEMANSLYGKLAQGSLPKRAFNSQDGKLHRLPPGRLSNTFLAAKITSSIRAVIGEILHGLPAAASICNITTDGLLTDAADAEVSAATEGPLCQTFAASRERITGRPEILAVKHRIRQPLGIRARGQATLEEAPGQEKIVLAKSGIKPPMKEKREQNRWLVDLFLGRNSETKVCYRELRTLKELRLQGGDLTSHPVERRANLDFDFKCQPVTPVMREICGVPHLAFDSRPWGSAAEFLAWRKSWNSFRRTRVLKTLEDYEDFLRFHQTPPGRHGRTRKPGGDVKAALQQFLRAWTREAWGLQRCRMFNNELAAWLTAAGYPCRREDVENAQRPASKLVEHSVARTDAVLTLIKVVTERFPAFQGDQLPVPTPDQTSPL